jgi:hypothetical protein
MFLHVSIVEAMSSSKREVCGSMVSRGGCEKEGLDAGVFACLDALGKGVRDGELGHVVVLVAQGDKVVVDAGLVLVGVVKVELLRLDVVRGKLLQLELGYLFQEALLLGGRHAPYYHDTVIEEEDLGCVHVDVKFGRIVAQSVVGDVLGQQVVGALVGLGDAAVGLSGVG